MTTKLDKKKIRVTGQKGGGVVKRDWAARDLRRRLILRADLDDTKRKLELAQETIRLQNTYNARLNTILGQLETAREIDRGHVITLNKLIERKDHLLRNRGEQVEVYREQVIDLHSVLEERTQEFHDDNNCECKATKVYKKQVKSLEKLASSSKSLIKYLQKELENKEEDKQRRDKPPSPPPPTRSESPAEDGEVA